RAETLSVVSAFVDLEDNLFAASLGATPEVRKTAHEKALVESVPAYLRYQERFVRGTYYFGDKVTYADLKLYQIASKLEEMYGPSSPLKTRAADFPKLTKIVESLAAGKAGDYTRNRRIVGIRRWFKDEWTWGFVAE
ncbi:hypothetical protein EXIGLDRAFT_768538, partial [Exidia glandulosa HHB12029]